MPNPRKPDNVHKLKGTYQPCRHGDADTKPDWNDGFPTMPKCVSKIPAAKKEWKYIESIAPTGVVVKTDKSLMTQYCLLWAQMESEGLDFSGAKHSQLRLIEADLGFTPISRGKIGGTPKKQDDSGFQSNPR